MKALVQNVINGSNFFSNILNTSFNGNSEREITFNQYSDYTETETDGKQGGDYFHLTVDLNFAALENASQEHIMATIYHEILHAYLLGLKECRGINIII